MIYKVVLLFLGLVHYPTGSGKSLAMGNLILENKKGKTIIVCAPTIAEHWKDELSNLYWNDNGTIKRLVILIYTPKLVEFTKKNKPKLPYHDVLIVPYTKKDDNVSRFKYYRLIIDEGFFSWDNLPVADVKWILSATPEKVLRLKKYNVYSIKPKTSSKDFEENAYNNVFNEEIVRDAIENEIKIPFSDKFFEILLIRPIPAVSPRASPLFNFVVLFSLAVS